MGGKKGKGRAVKRARQKFGLHYEDEEVKLAPHTMIFHRGDCNKPLRHLVKDMRQVMEPYTASSLKNTDKNNLKDFITIAGPLHVSHLMIFTETEVDGYIKMIRLPRGPTLHFKIEDFSLNRDVISGLKKPSTNLKQFLHQPLLVLNGFHLNTTDNSEENKQKMHHKLMATMLQNMFPSINIAKVHLSDIRRCAMFNYNADDETVDFRHYNIRIAPVGLSKPVKKLVQEKIPNMSSFQDISEYMEKGGLLSESEAELDTAENKIVVPEDMMSAKGGINLKNTTSAIRLTEIGPRIKMKLIKIQEGVCEGEVLYHMFMNKTPEEIQEIREKAVTTKKKGKSRKPKKPATEEDGKKEVKKERKDGRRRLRDYEKNDVETHASDDDDVTYFKDEVGIEPIAGLLQKKSAKKRRIGNDSYLGKTNGDYDNVNLNGNIGDEDSDVAEGEHENKKQKIVKFESKSAGKTDPKKAKPLFLRFSNKKKQQLKK